jgi:hypothetical protein
LRQSLDVAMLVHFAGVSAFRYNTVAFLKLM